VEHQHVASVLGRLIWGTDTSAFYRGITRLADLPAPGSEHRPSPRSRRYDEAGAADARSSAR
jgi:hypothetical protein